MVVGISIASVHNCLGGVMDGWVGVGHEGVFFFCTIGAMQG